MIKLMYFNQMRNCGAGEMFLRPRKAFIASWVATGFFEKEHFPENVGMTQQEALDLLDPSGMLIQMGIPSEEIVQALDVNRLGHLSLWVSVHDIGVAESHDLSSNGKLSK